jgi:low affinity Fe/Cu permease
VSDQDIRGRRRPLAWLVGNEHERRRQGIAAGLFVIITVVLWATSTPPFSDPPNRLPAHPSFWQIVLADRTTVGLVRMTMIVLGLFLLASIPALVVAGRWINTFGSSMRADAARSAASTQVQVEQRLRETERALESVKADRKKLRDALEECLRELRTDTPSRAS